MSTTISFYKVGFEKNTLKNPSSVTGLSSGRKTSQTGNIFDPINVVNPIVEVNISNIESYNLMYIGAFSRYYWITEYEYIAEGNVCKIHGESAVLLNWYDAIINTRTKVTKSTRFYNKHLINSDFPILDQRKITIDKFPKSIPNKDCVLLTTLGGIGGGI